MSREHLLPRAIDDLISHEHNGGHYFLEKSPSKFLQAAPAIRDVCCDCNNGVLSQLDAYAFGLFRDHCGTCLRKGDKVRISYDWELLSRWLLKVHYNSARIHNREVEIIRPYRDYILGQGPVPKRLSLYAFAVYTYVPSMDERLRMIACDTGIDSFEPDMLRISIARFNTSFRGSKVARLVVYKSIAFVFLLASRKCAAIDFNHFEHDFISVGLNASLLRRDALSITLVADTVDQMRMLAGHVSRFRKEYEGLEGWLEAQNGNG